MSSGIDFGTTNSSVARASRSGEVELRSSFTFDRLTYSWKNAAEAACTGVSIEAMQEMLQLCYAVQYQSEGPAELLRCCHVEHAGRQRFE